MITKESILSVSDFRKNAATVLEEVGAGNGPFYLFSRSKPKAVLLDFDDFSKLQEAYEDISDMREIIAISKKDIKKGIPWEDFKKKNELGK